MDTGEGTNNESLKREWNASWLGGAVLVAVGAILSLQSLTGLWFDTWWVLLIAIPGVAALATAWHLYQKNGGRLDRRVAGAVAGSFFPLFLAAVFLFELDWGAVWPVFLIIAGVAGLLNRAVAGQEAGI